MKVPYGEGLATRTGPESCAVGREAGGEALTGERAGRVLSRESQAPPRERRSVRGADAVRKGGRPHLRRREREMPKDPARSETPSMYPKRLAREPGDPASVCGQEGADRTGKSKDVRR